MTGKELMIALVGAGLVGGASGVAANVAMAPKERPVEQPVADVVAERLKRAEDDLAKTRTALDESHKSIVDLNERLTKAEIAAAKQAAPASRAPQVLVPGARVVHGVRRGGATDAATGAADDAVVGALGAIDVAMPEGLDAEIGKAIESLGGDLAGGGQLATLQSGLALRKLPEDQRWQKAKDDLGLTWNQVEDLKKAVADRDASLKDASNVEKKNGPNGGTITISRPDPAKTAHAQADYQDRVNATLNEDQKKNWQAKGYDHAFGKGGFGGAMVMTVDVATDKSGDAPKDGNK